MSIKTGQYAVSNFLVEIDGKTAGYLSTFQPPSFEREEMTSALGPDIVTKKGVSNTKVGEASAQYNISQANEWLEWCRTVWKKQCVEKNVVVNLADQDYNLKRGIEMMDCCITGIEWPALKASDKSDFKVTAKFQPQRINYIKGSGKAQSQLGKKAKNWQVANWKVHEFAGLKTSHITSQDICKITPKLAREQHGQFDHALINYASVDIGSVKNEWSSASYQQCEDWARRVLLGAEVDEASEQTMIIDMLAPNMKDILGTFTLIGCGLKKFDWAPKLEGGKEGNALCTMEWLVEDFDMVVTHK